LNNLFTAAEGALLVRMLVAHGVVDFFLQSNKGVADKQARLWASPYLWKHILLITLFAWGSVWSVELWYVAAIIGVTHLFIDVAKLWANTHWNPHNSAGRALWMFLLDQLLHVAIITGLWLWIINGWEKFGIVVPQHLFSYEVWLRILGYIIVIGPVRFIIRYFVERWSPDIEQSNDGLKDAGITIGVLERVLVLTLVFIEQYAGIGFLVAAKSILRLIDKPWLQEDTNFSSRKHTEYVLIGTFLSFGLALFTGLIINWILRL
jgi:hypothetical protein